MGHPPHQILKISLLLTIASAQINDPNYNQYNSQPYNPQQYDNRQQYNNNRQFDNNRQYDSNRPYDPNRQQYDPNRQQYDPNRQQYDPNRQQYDPNRQNDPNRQQFGNNNQAGSDTQFGSNRNVNSGPQYQYDNQRFGNDAQDNCCEEYCYATDEDPYLNFATKTSYDSLTRRTNQQQHHIPDCQAIQFWSLNRHGTRLPSAQRIAPLRDLTRLQEEVKKNHEERRSYPDKGRLCPNDYDLLKRWQWNASITEQRADSLTSQGIDELRLLARRYKAKFPQLFEDYSERNYNFQYTDTDKTHDSYQAYIEGLFGADAYKAHANVFPDDKLLKLYQTCRYWRQEVGENPATFDEYRKYVSSPEYLEMVRNIFKRLGFRYALNSSIVYDMWDLCRYEKAWNIGQKSPWCIAFNKEQLKKMEYAQDLRYYYNGGYGSELNKKLGCNPVKDMYEKFERAVNGDSSGPKVTVYFTHTKTLQPVLTAMGIAQDNIPLRADNYYQQARRQWKTSTISPFSANLAAVLYECRNNERYRVMFFLNEVPVEYPDCSVGLCNWATVKQKLQNVVETCNIDEFCEGNSSSAMHTSYFPYLIAIIAFAIYYQN